MAAVGLVLNNLTHLPGGLLSDTEHFLKSSREMILLYNIVADNRLVFIFGDKTLIFPGERGRCNFVYSSSADLFFGGGPGNEDVVSFPPSMQLSQ